MATYPRTTGTAPSYLNGLPYYPADGKVSFSPKTGRRVDNKAKVQREHIPDWEAYLIEIGAEYEMDAIGNSTFFWVTWRTPEANDAALSASGTNQVELNTTWSIEPIELSKDLWEHPLMIAQFALLSGESAIETRNIMRLRVEAFSRGESTIPNPSQDGESFTSTYTGIVASAEKLGMSKSVWSLYLDAISHKTTSFNLSSWSLKRRMVLPSGSDIKADLDNVNQLFTQSGMRTDLERHVAIPNTVRFILPSNGYWLKKCPTVSQNTQGSWEINQEWWWAEQYLPFIYGAPIK